jgi:hypothetical protein
MYADDRGGCQFYQVLDTMISGGQCYKTFYHGNLLPFHCIGVILSYKTVLLLWTLP